MKKIVKYILILALLTLSVAAFAACDNELGYDPDEMFTVTFVDSIDNTEIGQILVQSRHSIPQPEDPLRDGYRFLGWATEIWENGNGWTGWVFVDTNTVAKDVALYAVWQANSFSVKYNGNGSTSGYMFGSDRLTYGEENTLRPNEFKKTGYTFAGWALSVNGEILFEDATSVQLATQDNDTVELFAQWRGIIYSIEYYGNGATSGFTTSSNHIYDSASTLTENAFDRSGYTFAGWATSANGNITYADAASIKNLTTQNNGTIQLFARWFGSITYEGNGATTGTTQASDYLDGTTNSISLQSNGFNKAGHIFCGWATSPNGNVIYSDGQTVNVNTPQRLYAQWELVPSESGDGTKNNPFIFKTANQLINFAERVNAGQKYTNLHFALGKNIDLNNAEWIPIGSGDTAYFDGSLDGQGFIINNFKITRVSQYIGLFGYNKGNISNLGVKNFEINLEYSLAQYDISMGILVGENYGDISNCYISNPNVFTLAYTSYNSNSYAYIGGLIGRNNAKVTNSHSIGNISFSVSGYAAYAHVGLLIGRQNTADVDNCYSEGTIYGNSIGLSIGGLIGSFNASSGNGSVYGCYSIVNITTTSSSGSMGGLIGGTSALISNSYSNGDVSSTVSNSLFPYVGGLVGSGSTIINSYATGKVYINSTSGNAGAGGLVGACDTIINSYATGSVEARSGTNTTEAGGLVAWVTLKIENCHATGDITSSAYYTETSGGLVARSTANTIITNSYATGNIKRGSRVGGLIGENLGAVELCYATGNVNGSGDTIVYAGGLIGLSKSNSLVRNCYAIGNVVVASANPTAGGLIGANQAQVENCYAIGNVSTTGYGYHYVGGLAGGGANYSVKNCFAVGSISSAGGTLRISGFVSGDPIVFNCYKYDEQLINGVMIVDTASVVSCSYDVLNSTNFYDTSLDWSNEIWDFSDLDFANGKYPTLK